MMLKNVSVEELGEMIDKLENPGGTNLKLFEEAMEQIPLISELMVAYKNATVNGSDEITQTKVFTIIQTIVAIYYLEKEDR